MTVQLNTITCYLFLYSIHIFDAVIFTDFYIHLQIYMSFNVIILTEKQRR